MLLHHGTTRHRAESIKNNGPDVDFREPGSSPQAGKERQFHTALAGGPFYCGTPEQYARGKAKLFPQEGGPAILEIELPDAVADGIVNDEGICDAGKAINAGSDIWFEPGEGLKELLDIWDQFEKRVILLPEE